ncbi:uncharacterized protein LOC144599650 isoform X2 [Rhinoraja longicauda]
MWPFKTIRRIIVRKLKWLYAFCQFVVRFVNWKPLALYKKCKSIMSWPIGKNQGSNSEINFVGLNNQGATCYLNTLLQTWFMTQEVKDCISRSQSPDLFIVALKELFKQLTSEQTNSVCTKKLTTCLQLDVSKQNDIEVCFRNLMSNLSTRMDEENNILKIYQVTMVHSIMCSKCKEPLDNENLFLDIPLSMCSANTFVKFKCMEESLGAFLSVETMEGDNKCYCDVCGEKTESTSRYYFKKLPQILTFQLKRFEFDYNYMQYRKINDCINLPSDLKFKKSQVDYNEWGLKLPVNKAASDPFGAGPYLMEPQAAAGPLTDHPANSSNGTYRRTNTPSLASHGHISAAELQGVSCSGLRNPQRAQEEKDMEDSDISVDNPDVQGQFKITKEEVLTRNMVDKNPGPDGIHRMQLSEENNSGNNYSFGAMGQGQTLQWQEEYSVNDEERTTEAPGQSEQDSPDDKEKDMEDSDISVDNPDVQGQFKITKEEVLTRNMVDKNPGPDGIHRMQLSEENNSGNNYSFGAMGQGQTLQWQEEYSVNDEERTTEAPGQSEQDSPDDKEKDMEDSDISVDNPDVQGQFKITKEEVLTRNMVDKNPGPDGIHRMQLSEENNSGNNYSFGAMGQGQTLQWQEEYSVNDEERTTEAPGQSEQDSPDDKEKDMEDSDISVDNPDVQGQFKITKEEVLTRNMVDKNPGPDGIHRMQLSEENNSGNNYSFGAMGQGQTLQWQEEYSVNDEERTTEAPGQSEQDSPDDKENNSGNNYSFGAMEQGQSELSTLQRQEEYSVNDEERTTEAPGQSEQDSPDDKEKDMNNSDISVDNPDVQGQFKITKEEVLTRNMVDKNPGPDGIHRMQLSEENNSGNNYSFGAMGQGQTLQWQEEYSVNDEERTTEAPGQSEQDSPDDKEKKYELFAIWHHLGSYGGGHYYAEIKSGSGDWYAFDDRVVEKIGKNITLSSTTAYMVMYRLIDTNKEAESDATTPEQCQT